MLDSPTPMKDLDISTWLVYEMSIPSVLGLSLGEVILSCDKVTPLHANKWMCPPGPFICLTPCILRSLHESNVRACKVHINVGKFKP